MAKKKHFLRYSSKSDTLEAYSGRKKPGGSGWSEIVVNPCCPGQVGGCTYESEPIETAPALGLDAIIPPNCDVTIALQWDNVDIGNPVDNSESDNIYDLIGELNEQFVGFAHFTYDPITRRVSAKVNGCGPFNIFIEAICER